MRCALPLAAVVFGLSASPAPAADVVQLSCPRDRLSEAQRAGLGSAALAMAQMSDPRIQALTEALAACARSHAWSANAAEMARRYHLARAHEVAVRPVLMAAGLQLAEVERVILADNVLIARFQGGSDTIVMTDLIDRHRDLIMRTFGDRGTSLAEKFGSFLGAIALAEASRRGFIAD